MDKIKWCYKTKNGLEFIEENENLTQAYIKKAENRCLEANDLNLNS